MTNKKEYSKCVKCIKQDWCKAYDNTDLSLNDCNDFIGYENNINKILIPRIITMNNEIRISFKSDYNTAKKLESLIEKFVSNKVVKNKIINFAFVELETNLY